MYCMGKVMYTTYSLSGTSLRRLDFVTTGSLVLFFEILMEEDGGILLVFLWLLLLLECVVVGLVSFEVVFSFVVGGCLSSSASFSSLDVFKLFVFFYLFIMVLFLCWCNNGLCIINCCVWIKLICFMCW